MSLGEEQIETFRTMVAGTRIELSGPKIGEVSGRFLELENVASIWRVWIYVGKGDCESVLLKDVTAIGWLDPDWDDEEEVEGAWKDAELTGDTATLEEIRKRTGR